MIGAASGLSDGAPSGGANFVDGLRRDRSQSTKLPPPLLDAPAPASARGGGRHRAAAVLARATTSEPERPARSRSSASSTLDHDRYLDDHRVDGQPVFPFAAAMELMAESAVAATPAQLVVGVAGDPPAEGDRGPRRRPLRGSRDRHPAADRRRGRTDDRRRPTARACTTARSPAWAAPTRSRRPRPDPLALPELPAFPLPLRDAYRDLLFHGPIFQKIGAIAGMDGRGATAQLHPSVPGDCMSDSDGSRLGA